MRANAGATLVELLVVLAILAITLAVATPAIRTAKPNTDRDLERVLLDSLVRAVRDGRDIRVHLPLDGRDITAAIHADGTIVADSDFHSSIRTGAADAR